MLDSALAAYNAGSGNVSQWLTDERIFKDGKQYIYIPFAETKKYVDKVKVNYKIINTYIEKNKIYKRDVACKLGTSFLAL